MSQEEQDRQIAEMVRSRRNKKDALVLLEEEQNCYQSI